MTGGVGTLDRGRKDPHVFNSKGLTGHRTINDPLYRRRVGVRGIEEKSHTGRLYRGSLLGTRRGDNPL